jgi:bifunctional DNA-binding transcriptional regulator/antitoxin component of YhaV-PrlF toxin-antitoxin module
MKIGGRGQITIPKKLRERYGFFPSIEIEFVPEAGGVKIQKKTKHKSPVQEVYGILGREERTDEYIEEIRGR